MIRSIQDTVKPWPRSAGLLLAGLIVLTACAGAPRDPAADLPEFPKFEEADAFLEMQRRTAAARRPAPDPYRYTEKNQRVFDNLARQRRVSESLVEARSRAQEESARRHRAYNQSGWEAVQGNLARNKALDALQEAERAQYAQQFRVRNNERYRGYQSRLARLQREKEARQLEHQARSNRNQQRVNDMLAEFQERQESDL